MLHNNFYYWGTISKITYVFNSLFSKITLIRKPGDEAILVPIEYGPKEKWYVIQKKHPMPNVNDQVQMVLPRMTTEITGFVVDEQRKLTSTGRLSKVSSNSNSLQSQFNPVPYNIGFRLTIGVKNEQDGFMIVEQILPFFKPEYTVKVNDIPQLNLEKDIPFILNNVNNEVNWTGDLSTGRTVIWTLDFTAKAYVYPPISTQGVILQSLINMDIGTAENIPSMLVEPLPLNATADTVTGYSQSLVDPAIEITMLPSTATIAANTSLNFVPTIQNTLDHTVTYTLNPNLGSITNNGLYNAPTTVATTTTVVLQANSNANPFKFANSIITLTS